KDGDSLKLVLKESANGPIDFDTATQIILKDYFITLPQFGGISFANGDTVTAADLLVDLKTEGDDNGNGLNGYSGDDTFLGRQGDDHLYGLGGNDTYIYRAGDGNDTIYNQNSTNGINTLELQGIDPADVLLRQEKNSNHLMVHHSDGSKIRIANHFDSSGDYALDAITFDNGTRWEQGDMAAAVRVPTDNEDYIVGDLSDNLLAGGKGNDIIKGEAGDDTLTGGEGDDTLNGGEGSDTYHYQAGDGIDTIENYDASTGRHDVLSFDATIDKADIIVRQEESDLVLYWQTNKIVTVSGHFNSNNHVINAITFADGTVYDQTTLDQLILGASAVNDELTGTAADDVIEGLAGDDTLYGRDGNDTLDGGVGHDHLYGESGDDELLGGAGNDRLVGSSGNDRLQGGTGDDQLWGGQDNDTYEYALNEGHDTIADNDGSADQILFAAGITTAQVLLRRVESNLNIWIGGVLSLTVEEHFGGGSFTVENIAFADGTQWGLAAIDAAVILPSGIQDTLYGDEQANLLSGLAGDDALLGNGGDDTLTGGTGDDTLEGGMGSDTYHFSRGDGIDVVIDNESDATSTDTLVFDSSVAPDDIKVRHVSSGGYPWENDLVLTNQLSGDQITVKGYFGNQGYGAQYTDHAIKKVQFADGTVWTDSDFRTLSLIATETAEELYGGSTGETINGLGGDDIIRGGEGDDIIIGGSGNDTLQSSNGNDIYRYQHGDGFDFIDLETNDVLQLQDINASDVWLHTNANSQLEIALKDGSGSITIKSNLNALHFADGTQWDATAINAATVGSTPLDDYLNGTSADDSLTGLAGNDTLQGGQGDDTYHFSRNDGVDTIYDSGGFNTLSFAAGISPSDVVVWRDVRENWPEEFDLFVGVKGTNQQIRIEEFHSTATTYQLVFADTPSQVFTNEDLLATSDFSLDHYYQTLNLDLSNMTPNSPAEWGDTWDYGIFTSADSEATFFNQGSIWAGEGDDIVVSAQGGQYHELDGGLGDDVIYGGGADGQLYGGPASTTSDTQSHYYRNYWDFGGFDYPSGVDEESYPRTYPADGNDQLYAEGGDDTLHGGEGDDLLVGGHGQDRLSGGEGNDRYLFNLGDGQDRIIAAEHTADVMVGYGNKEQPADFSNDHDRLEFGSQITASDVIVRQVGNHLELSLRHSQDSVTVEQFFSTDAALREGIKEVHFEDGTIWNLSDIFGQVSTTNWPATPTYLVDHSSDPTLSGDTGDNVLIGNGSDNTLTGLAGRDGLYGGDGNDQLLGGIGNDLLHGQDGDDHLVGGSGNDTLIGGNQNDTYFFSAGFGQDIIDNYDDTLNNFATDTIAFDTGIAWQDVQLTQQGDDLIISHFSDVLTVRNHFLGIGLGFNQRYAIDAIHFADSTVWAASDIDSLLLSETNNQAPVINAPLSDQAVAEDVTFTYQVPSNTFSDPDAGDTLSLTAALSDGSPLPGWLSFDGATSTFSGTPDNDQVGTLELLVTATDSEGAAISDTFAINISNVNDAPTLVTSIADQAATADTAFSLQLPAGTFVDIDVADQLTLSATLADGSALPSWLAFDVATGVLAGTPNNSQTGTLNVQITATDNSGATSNDTFELVISETNTPTGNIIEGTPGDDLLTGSAGNDTFLVEGTDQGYDTFIGGDGFDTVLGSTGDDVFGLKSWDINNGIERIDGGTGFNIIKASTGNTNLDLSTVELLNIAEIHAGSNHNTVVGTSGNDTIVGQGGNDTLSGGAGNDTFRVEGTDQGYDTFSGGDGFDTVQGGTGDDVFGLKSWDTNNGIERIDGGDGFNIIKGSGNADLDLSTVELLNIAEIHAGNNHNTVVGTSDDDIIVGQGGNDTLSGGAGNDTFR
ncbi:MAG: hypothetical protein GY934_24365, partial [Gammaproteobacteria bacterium]|nr:hypothetical protein [Gammaproteobacteria bacterium]